MTSPLQAAVSTPTRENCLRCGRRGFSFVALKPIWLAVAGEQWEHSKLCIICFADLGDEKNVAWEVGLKHEFMSMRSHHDFIATLETS